MSTYRFLATVVISTMLGIILGSSAYFISTLFKEPVVDKPIIYTQINQPILLSEANNLVQVNKEDEDKKNGEEIIYVEKKEEPTPTPTAVPIIPEILYSEATSSGQVTTQIVPVSTPSPTEVSVAESPVLNAEVIFNLVNQERTKAGLAPVIKDERVCEVTNSRAPEITKEILGGYMHAGFYNRNLPYWASEIVIYMRTEHQAINWWMNSGVHRSQILGDYKYSCAACSGQSCTQIFTNFTSK